MVTLNKKLIKESKEILKQKLEWWKQHYPNVKFDQNGRAEITKEFTTTNPEKKYRCVSSHVGSIRWMSTNARETIKTELLHSYKIDLDLFLEKVINAIVEGKKTIKLQLGKHSQEVKIIKIVQKIENKILPELMTEDPTQKSDKIPVSECIKMYQNAIKQGTDLNGNQTIFPVIRQLRGQLMGYKQLYMFSYHIDQAIQIIKKQNKLRTLSLTINPLDFFSLAEGLSTFTSCLATEFNHHDNGNLTINKKGMHSDPLDTFLLGSMDNTAIVGVFSSNEVTIHDSTLKGFNSRSLVFADYNGVCVSRNYPQENECGYTENALIDFLNTRVKSWEEEFNCSNEKSIQDYLNTLYQHNNLFLDDVGIDFQQSRYVLTTLPSTRTDLDYGENIVRYLDGINKFMCAHCSVYFDETDATYIEDLDSQYCTDCVNSLLETEEIIHCEECGILNTYDNQQNNVCSNCSASIYHNMKNKNKIAVVNNSRIGTKPCSIYKRRNNNDK